MFWSKGLDRGLCAYGRKDRGLQITMWRVKYTRASAAFFGYQIVFKHGLNCKREPREFGSFQVPGGMSSVRSLLFANPGQVDFDDLLDGLSGDGRIRGVGRVKIWEHDPQ